MLERIDADIWGATDTVRLPAGVVLPVRMTVVRLATGELWLHSPIAMDDALAAEIAALGEVAHIAAPNRFHHLHVGAAASRFPRAKVHGALGLAEKRPDLRLDAVLGQGEPGWGAEIAAVRLDGAPMVSETVFWHAPSASLIVTDLFFHVLEARNLATRLFLGAAGAMGKLARGREWALLTRDRRAMAASLDRVLAWPCRRVIPAHGEVFEDVGEGLLAAALRRPDPRREAGGASSSKKATAG